MNLDLFVQNLVKEITQTVSTVPGVEPGQEGEERGAGQRAAAGQHSGQQLLEVRGRGAGQLLLKLRQGGEGPAGELLDGLVRGDAGLDLLDQAQQQLSSTYDLLEQGIYTLSTFQERRKKQKKEEL